MASRLPHILYVQNDDTIREVITTFLQEMGYCVMAASTRAEGLALAGGFQFDIHLIERRLPDGKGIEMCRKLSSFRPRTPTLLISGFDTYIEKRGNHYVIKPADPFELERAISRLIYESKHVQVSLQGSPRRREGPGSALFTHGLGT